MAYRSPPRLSPALKEALHRAPWDEINEDDGTVNAYTNNPREITPGVIDGEAIAYYRYGNCALLAIEISRTTGWPLIMLAAQKTLPTLNDTPMVHVMVRRPDGRLIDINGADREADALGDWKQRFPDVHAVEITEEELMNLICEDERGLDLYSPLERELTRDFAERVIKQYDS